MKAQSDLLSEAGYKLKPSPEEVPQAVDRLLKRTKELESELEGVKQKSVKSQGQELWNLLDKVKEYGQFKEKLEQEIGLPGLRSMADDLRKRRPDVGILLIDSAGNGVAASGERAVQHGIHADELLKSAGAAGGGRKDMAQGRMKS